VTHTKMIIKECVWNLAGNDVKCAAANVVRVPTRFTNESRNIATLLDKENGEPL
jgi:hypothetical protein